MQIKCDFSNVEVLGLVLAKVGNSLREEELITSQQVFRVEPEDQEMLGEILTRPFKSLPGQRFQHHSSLEMHEMNGISKSIFADESTLLEQGQAIAARLYAKSRHPKIKSGDLCIALLNGVEAEGERRRALCILKSESVTPFLSISTHDGDLKLHVEQGIYPEKIDKGCLILEYRQETGYYVQCFDRGGQESRFWVRDFLAVVPIADGNLFSQQVAAMAIQATASVPTLSDNEPDDLPPWETNRAAGEALNYLNEREHFSLAEFEEQALRTPEAKAKFAEARKQWEEEAGVKLQDGFEISKREVGKAHKLLKTSMKLDTGVEVRLKPMLAQDPTEVIEYGYDEKRGMRFMKIYYNKDLQK